MRRLKSKLRKFNASLSYSVPGKNKTFWRSSDNPELTYFEETEKVTTLFVTKTKLIPKFETLMVKSMFGRYWLMTNDVSQRLENVGKNLFVEEFFNSKFFNPQIGKICNGMLSK